MVRGKKTHHVTIGVMHHSTAQAQGGLCLYIREGIISNAFPGKHVGVLRSQHQRLGKQIHSRFYEDPEKDGFSFQMHVGLLRLAPSTQRYISTQYKGAGRLVRQKWMPEKFVG